MKKFVEFWGGIWEKNERTPNMPWMEEVKMLLSENVTVVRIRIIRIIRIIRGPDSRR